MFLLVRLNSRGIREKSGRILGLLFADRSMAFWLLLPSTVNASTLSASSSSSSWSEESASYSHTVPQSTGSNVGAGRAPPAKAVSNTEEGGNGNDRVLGDGRICTARFALYGIEDSTSASVDLLARLEAADSVDGTQFPTDTGRRFVLDSIFGTTDGAVHLKCNSSQLVTYAEIT